MRYIAYTARKYIESTAHNHFEKRLGILGECHLYNEAESEFAKTVVPNYKNMAMEGHGKNSGRLRYIAPLFVPMLIAYAAATDRFPFVDAKSALEIAEDKKLRIFRLEKPDDNTESLMQYVAKICCGLASIPLSPYFYFHCKKHGDPFINYDTKKKPGSLIGKISRFAFTDDIGERNSLMCERSYKIFTGDVSDLLVVCGDGHFDAFDEFYNQRFCLEKIVSARTLTQSNTKLILP